MLSKKIQTTTYWLMVICIYLIVTTLIYYLYKFSWLTALLGLLLGLILAYLIIPSNDYRINSDLNFSKNKNLIYWLLVSCFLFFAFLTFWQLSLSSSLDAISSPWKLVNNYFWIYYFITLIVFLLLQLTKKSNKITNLIVFIFYFLNFSVAAIIYRLGFGFDGFIHRTAVKEIIGNGFILPKSFYYIGQYMLEAGLVILSKLPLTTIDNFLLPLIASIFLPSALRKIKGPIALLGFLMIPFSFLTYTNPQNLGFLFLIILLCYAWQEPKPWLVLIILSLSIILIHPLAGIPAVIYLITLFLFKKNPLSKTSWLLASFSGFSLPLVFIIYHYQNNFLQWQSIVKGISRFLLDYSCPVYNNFNNILNSVYQIGFYRWIFILIAFILISIVKIIKNNNYLKLHLVISASFLLGFIFSLFFNFNYLIDYEENYFRQRFLFVSFIFLLPIFFYGFETIFYKIKNLKNLLIKFIWLFLLAVLIGVNFYLSYPKNDDWQNDHNFSTSIDDINAVKFIEEQGSGEPYIVLANQQVSAAALSVYGFKKYYQGHFYYSLPTGGPLYQLFLSITKDPRYENIMAAAEIANVKRVFLVLNNYWWAYDKIKNEIAEFASLTHQLGNVVVFDFKLD